MAEARPEMLSCGGLGDKPFLESIEIYRHLYRLGLIRSLHEDIS
jgi:hypothetical protein